MKKEEELKVRISPEDFDLLAQGKDGVPGVRLFRIVLSGQLYPHKALLREYVTEGTFDAYLYQTLENKQKFISQIMTSKSPVRSSRRPPFPHSAFRPALSPQSPPPGAGGPPPFSCPYQSPGCGSAGPRSRRGTNRCRFSSM